MNRNVGSCGRRSAPVWLGALACAAVLAWGAAALPGHVLAGTAADQSVNGCTGPVSGRAEPDTIRCDPSMVTLGVLPTCPVCPGGLRVVFVQREIATESRWMNNEAIDVLETLRQVHTGPGLQAAVVVYGPGRAHVSEPMTGNLDSVRSALSRSTSNSNPPDHNNAASSAAREAVRQFQPQTGDDPALPPCKLVVFFAQDSPTPG